MTDIIALKRETVQILITAHDVMKRSPISDCLLEPFRTALQQAAPQAQAGEPEVVAYAGNNGELHPTTQGYTVLSVGDDLITLQSHREAMSEQALRYLALDTQFTEMEAKKDTALKACIEALKVARPCISPFTLQDKIKIVDAATTKAHEALK